MADENAGAPVPPPLTGSQLVLGTIALSLATFMNVLDTSIANVSIPAIAGDLGVSPDQGTWVITSFGVANAISLPLTGWLTRRFGQVRLFLASVVLFVIASFLCALAPTLSLLILFRVVQGAVAGPMIPLSQSLLLASYPRTRAGTALAMWAMTTLVAPVVGPLLGGWITDNISWPWIFYINVPVGIAAALVTWGIYHKRETATARVPVDTVGLGLLVIWVGAMQIMLDKGKDLDWFNSSTVVALACVAVVAFAIF
ncbi:MAG TPA: DHA2 family efflux MFS transporter permease subunit, partial [Burkholderiaceae bacterium]